MKRTLLVFLLVNLIVSACAPASAPTPTPAPSATPPPTATSFPTATPTPAPTATPTPIPTIQVGDLSVPDPRVTNPELFDLRNPNAPIPQFVNAMKRAGIEITAEQVASRIRFQTLKGINSKSFVVGMIDFDPNPQEQGETFEGPIPIFIAQMDEENLWNWSKITLRAGELFGLPIGGSGNLGDVNWRDVSYQQLARSEFSLWVDTGSFMEITIHQWPPDRLTIPILQQDITKKTRIHPLLWIHDIPDSLSVVGVNSYFDHRVADVLPYLKALKGRDTEIVLANEPFWCFDSHCGWGKGVFYQAYGERWITEAFVRLYEGAAANMLRYGQDYHVMLVNEYDIEIPTRKSDFVMRILPEIKNEIEARIGTPISVTIGLQFHIGADADNYIRVDPQWLADRKNISTLSVHFRRLSEVGRLSVTELDFDGRIAPEQQAKILYNLVRAIQESQVVNDLTFWSPLRKNNPFKPNIFELDTYQPTANYYVILQALMAHSSHSP